MTRSFRRTEYRYARASARATSSGANRSNMPFQMIATSAGATSSCGKRASASLAVRRAPPRGRASRAAPQSRARSPRDSRTRRASGKRAPSVMISRITSLRRVPKISRTNMSAMVSAIMRAGTSASARLSIAPTTGRQHRAHELLEQALLVAEVEIDRALGDAGAAGDVVEPRRGKAARRRTPRARRPGSHPAARPGATVRALRAGVGAAARGRRPARSASSPRVCLLSVCGPCRVQSFMTDWSVIYNLHERQLQERPKGSIGATAR